MLSSACVQTGLQLLATAAGELGLDCSHDVKAAPPRSAPLGGALRSGAPPSGAVRLLHGHLDVDCF